MTLARLRIFDETPSARVRRVCRIAFACYMAMVLWGAWHHVPWGDEADPWVMAVHTNFHNFIRYFSYTGHPPLWLVVLMPLARLGLPVESMQVLNASFAAGAAWLLLFRSPFALWLKLVFLFSVGMGFQYPVVSRGYMLMIMLMFLLAQHYEGRLRCPLKYGALLALLFNTESFVIVPAALLAVFFTWECLQQAQGRWRYVAAVGIAVVGAMVAFVSLLPVDTIDDMQRFYREPHVTPKAFFNQLRYGFLSVTYYHHIRDMYPLIGGVAQEYCLIPAFLVLGLMAVLLRNTRWLLVMLSWLIWFYIIFVYFYPGTYWHGELFPVFVMWTLWLYRKSGQEEPETSQRMDRFAYRGLAWCLMVVFLMGDYTNYLSHRDWERMPYSGSREMAEYMREKGYDKVVVLSLACYKTSSISAYLPDTLFWISGQDRISHYQLWGVYEDICLKQQNRVTQEVLDKAADREQIVLTSGKMLIAEEVPFRVLRYTRGLLESFGLYAIGPLKKVEE